jgi:hypothetical protein
LGQGDGEHDDEFRRTFFLQRIPEEEMITFSKCEYINDCFKPYAALRSRDDEEGTAWAPFRGQSFNESIFEFAPGGWDHEHCDVCRRRIEDGDRYWTNPGFPHVDFCMDCYPLVIAEIQARNQ